jgi:hypothetical protein
LIDGLPQFLPVDPRRHDTRTASAIEELSDEK